MDQNGWFIVENCLKMDDLGVYPNFRKTPMSASPILMAHEITLVRHLSERT